MTSQFRVFFHIKLFFLNILNRQWSALYVHFDNPGRMCRFFPVAGIVFVVLQRFITRRRGLKENAELEQFEPGVVL